MSFNFSIPMSFGDCGDCTQCPTPIKAICGISQLVNNGDIYSPFSSNPNVAADAAYIINNWPMGSIPWGQCLFVFFDYPNTYTTVMPSDFLTNNPSLSSANPSGANLDLTLAAQGLYQTVDEVVYPVPGGAAIYGGTGVCTCEWWGLFRSQYIPPSIAGGWNVKGWPPTTIGSGLLVPDYGGTEACCFDGSTNSCSSDPYLTFTGGLLNVPVPDGSLAPGAAYDLPAFIALGMEGPISVGYKLTLGSTC